MMLKKESTGDGDTGVAGGNNNWARVCDTCRAAACTVYCKADSAYLCSSCDSRIHVANRLASRHERVWVCEACESAPATFLCKADAASLCNACDASIHSANPLARRHQRVPILPISGDLNGAGRMNEELFGNMEEDGEEEEDETASWLLLNNDPVKKDNNSNSVNQNNNFMFGGEVDEYLDLVEYNSNQYNIDNNEHYDDYGDNKNYGDESHVVPVQCEEEDGNHQYHNFQMGFDFESSKSGYSYNHGVPVSSMEVGMVSETAMDQEVSNKHMSRAPKGTIDLFSNHTTIIDQEMSNRDREAKVLRYREKKKNRKFEKTIRYASRKAYAETRPRIKGRFAKRSPTDSNLQEVDHLLADTAYGIVPAHAF